MSMAPISLEEPLIAKAQTARIRAPKPNLVAKFALFMGTSGLIMLGSNRRCLHDDHPDLVFQIYLLANLITFFLGLLPMSISMVARPDSTTIGNGKIMMWLVLFLSIVTLALGSFLLSFEY